MANRITLCTIGPQPAPGDWPRDHEKCVEHAIAFWRDRFARVLPDRPDLIAVPECCDRPPHLGDREEQQAYYRCRGNRVRDYFASVARDHRCYIAYAAVRESKDGTFRNSVQLLDRTGQIAGAYNKNHTVISETTEGGILCGREATVIETDFGRVGCVICFDLNFEQILRRYQQLKPDLMVFCSMYHGGLMQAYWAYALRCHLLTSIAGPPSGVLSPVGHTLAMNTNYFEHVTAAVNLDCAVVHLDGNWDRIAAMKQRYGREARMFDPGHLGSVLISSESPARTVNDLIAEFGIERLDDYFNRAMAFHADPQNIERLG